MSVPPMRKRQDTDDGTDNLARDEKLGQAFLKELREFQKWEATIESDDDGDDRLIKWFDLCARGMPHWEGLADLHRVPLKPEESCTIPRLCV